MEALALLGIGGALLIYAGVAFLFLWLILTIVTTGMALSKNQRSAFLIFIWGIILNPIVILVAIVVVIGIAQNN